MKKKIIYFSFVLIVLILVFFIVIFIVNFKGNIKYIYGKNDNTKELASNNIDIFNGMIGKLTISKIGIIDEEVREGTDDEILKKSIGHFETSGYFNGNVCLAAHNYKVGNSDLFSNINKLEIGDSVIYNTSFGKKEYEVYKTMNIKSDDFSVLENSQINEITLITCIDNRKDMRLCVKAKERWN